MHAKCVGAADTDKNAREWDRNTHSQRVVHLFSDMSALTEHEGYCWIQGRDCKRDPVIVDVCSCGTPCTPFTTFRTNKKAVPVELHEDFHVTFTLLLAYLRTVRPGCGFLEQVRGFFSEDALDAAGNSLGYSYGEFFMRLLCELGYFAISIMVDMSSWLKVPRPRQAELSNRLM